MDRLERLLNLAAELLAAERALTREELRDRLGAYPSDDASFRRAFERDKDALRSMGMPLVVEHLDAGDPDSPEGYRIRREDYELPDPGLDADELAALHLAVSAVRGIEGAEAMPALWKLGGTVGAGESAAPADVALEGSEHLPTLFGAVSARRRVEFVYRDEPRRLEPWRLAFRNGRWYVNGWDADRGEERQFRLDRMQDSRVVGEPAAFERPANTSSAPPPPWEMGEEEPVTARLVIDAGQAAWAEARLGADTVVERRPDGSIVAEVTVRNTEGFRSFVLSSFLDHAEVLEPPVLREDIVSWLEGLAR